MNLAKKFFLMALKGGFLASIAGGTFAVVYDWLGSNEREKQQIYQDWQVINISEGKPGDGGRKTAIEDLYKLKIPMSGLSAPKAYLADIVLSDGSSSNHADLTHANLSFADLNHANLSNANLEGANLNHANLFPADLTHANLFDANLSFAYLNFADLDGAFLVSADLTHANLSLANLSNAYLGGANLEGADLFDANLSLAKNLTNKQIKSACNWEKAIYTEADYDEGKSIWFVKDEKANQRKIDEIKQDKASDPSQPPNCKM